MKAYHVGSPLGWSDLFWFKTLPSGSDWSPRFAIFGDMGNINAQSLPRLQKETQEGMYDMVIHVGDMAYNMDDVSIPVDLVFVSMAFGPITYSLIFCRIMPESATNSCDKSSQLPHTFLIWFAQETMNKNSEHLF